MDLIMGRFADSEIADLSAAELDEFERLSGVPDDELYSWIIRGAAPADYDGTLFRRLCDFQFRRNER
jgi:antitoxin CptB